MSAMPGPGRIWRTGSQPVPVKMLVPPDVAAAKDHLRAHVVQFAQFPGRMERVVIVGGRGTVPHSELAMHCRCAGKEIYAAAIAYADHHPARADAPSSTLTAWYAYVLTLDGEIYDGLPGEVASYASLEDAGETVRRHDAFEWLDGHWYITQTGWKETPADYRDVKDGQPRRLVNGERGTMLVPITIIGDAHHPPRVERPQAR
jgi:hypothetical protein